MQGMKNKREDLATPLDREGERVGKQVTKLS